jgi:stage II sporulation protein AA (anti-sigma F factor antagonist)
MTMIETRSEGVVTLALSGRLDGTSSAEFQTKLLGLIEAGDRRMILDMSRLDYVNSMGVSAFVLAAKLMKPVGGRIVLCGLRPMVKHIFEFAALSTVFPIAATLEEAEGLLGS